MILKIDRSGKMTKLEYVLLDSWYNLINDNIDYDLDADLISEYTVLARHFNGLRIIESAAERNQILSVLLLLHSTQIPAVFLITF